MASTTTKPPPKNRKRKAKSKLQPVTSGSKPGTPGPSTSVNLNLPLDCGDFNAKSGPVLDPTIDLASQSTPSSSSSSRLYTGEPEAESVLNVIGTPALPSHSPTPAPKTQSKSTARTPAATLSPISTHLLPPATMSKNPESAAPAPFGVNEEFIAFTLSDSDEETAPVPVRELDQGKQDIDVEKRGKKRKSGEMSRDDREYDRDGRRERGHGGERDGDRYGERRQRMENVPRYAPWIVNTNWDRCTNVAEL